MGDAEGYLELIRGDPFLGRMLASYERASKRGRNLDVLDYGCGYGWGSYVLSEFCSRVTGYDPDEGRISFAERIFIKENIRFCPEEQALAGRCYDMACLFMVLPYVKEADTLLEKLGGYVRQGGVVYLSYKSGHRRLPLVLEQWEEAEGFSLLTRKERYLTESENLIECSYCKNR